MDSSKDEMEDVEGTFESAKKRSDKLEESLRNDPSKHRVLTGDRPTGPLHIGHYFGSLQNRVRIQEMYVSTYIVIADYQVLTDRDGTEAIRDNVKELVLDYLAAGLDPMEQETYIFCHSQVPSLNQLLVPFLTLVSMSELSRNPTVKEEIEAAGLSTVNAGMYTYPVHQTADILFCKGDVVPVGKDQLSHLEISRRIARRFNQKYDVVFPEPSALLSESPKILGLDGVQKMSKSRNNAIAIRASADETAALIKKATTDSERVITFNPAERPGVSNLLSIAGLCTGEDPRKIAEHLGSGGAGELKKFVTTAVNDFFAPIRLRRAAYAAMADDVVEKVLRLGAERANELGEATLDQVRAAMNMNHAVWGGSK